MELPEDLKIHYRYVDFYSLLENEISKSHLIVDINSDQLLQGQYSWWKNPECSVKIFYPAGYRSLEIEDLTPFSWHNFRIPSGSAHMRCYGTEWHNGVLKKIGVFKDYSCWENSSCISSGLDGYVFYENNLIGVLNYTQYFKDAVSHLDFTSYWYGDPNDTITVPYGNHYYVYRFSDQFNIISNANFDLSQGIVKFDYTWYSRTHYINKGDSDNDPTKWKYYTEGGLGTTSSHPFYLSPYSQTIYYDEFSKGYLTQLCMNNSEQDITGSILNIKKEGLL